MTVLVAAARGVLRALRVAPVAALVAVAALASAHAEPRFDAQQLHMPATSSGYMAVDDPGVLGHLRGQAGVMLSYGRDPIVLRGADGAILSDGHLVRNQTALEIVGSVGILDRLEIGLAMPILLQQSGDDAAVVNDAAGTLRDARGVAFGDLRLDVKVLAIDHRFGHRVAVSEAARIGHRLRVGLAVGVTAPTASTALAGDENATGRPRLLFEWAYRRLRLALNVGAIFRARVRALGLDITHQVTWGIGGRVLLPRGFELMAEGRGAVGVALPPGAVFGIAEAPAELDVGVGYEHRIGLRVFLAGGLGVGGGYGAPAGRFIFGARFTVPEPPKELPWAERDTDHDGLLNGVDQCANEAGPLANQGCPDSDLDGDGVLDRFDRCPERVGVADNEGCPDLDSDGDNVPDRLDRCPERPGTRATQGCPVDDADGDGVPDAKDRCRDRPGTVENDGCPDQDSDGDGLVDRLDKCPFEAESYNGISDDDGCPDAGAALAELGPGQISLFGTISFERKNAEERLTPASLPTLAAVGALLNAHRELRQVRIDGHTDDRGSAIDNLELSLVRAKIVRHHLLDVLKVDAARVSAQGFGGDRPLGDNATPQGRARNRRIEITILEVVK